MGEEKVMDNRRIKNPTKDGPVASPRAVDEGRLQMLFRGVQAQWPSNTSN